MICNCHETRNVIVPRSLLPYCDVMYTTDTQCERQRIQIVHQRSPEAVKASPAVELIGDDHHARHLRSLLELAERITKPLKKS